MKTFRQLIGEALHARHETDLSLSYDCDTLAVDIEEYIRSQVVVEFKEFTHGYPFGYNCTFPTCTVDGHKLPVSGVRPEIHYAWGNEGYCICGLFGCPVLLEKVTQQYRYLTGSGT